MDATTKGWSMDRGTRPRKGEVERVGNTRSTSPRKGEVERVGNTRSTSPRKGEVERVGNTRSTTPRMGEVDRVGNKRSRAMQEQLPTTAGRQEVGNAGAILPRGRGRFFNKYPSIPLFQRRRCFWRNPYCSGIGQVKWNGDLLLIHCLGGSMKAGSGQPFERPIRDLIAGRGVRMPVSHKVDP
jgi:hypothetical protein